jgi:DNA-binding NarL/FixJ family response regulator
MLPVESIRVLVLYGDPLVSTGLAATLREPSDFELVPTLDGRPHVVVADYEQGLALIAADRARGAVRHASGPRVLIVTRRDSEREIRHALEHGARGYLTLGCALDELVDAVRMLHRGMRHIGPVAARRLADSVACALLTARETDVLRLVVQGHGNKTIAKRLDIALGTVKTHLKAIFQKLDATSRTEVAAVAERRGLLALPIEASQRGIDAALAWSPAAAARGALRSPGVVQLNRLEGQP